MRETRSHLSMRQRGLVRAASIAEEASIIHATAFMNVNRDHKKYPQPIELAHPWDTDPNSDVTPEMRVDLAARLETVSAFPGAA